MRKTKDHRIKIGIILTTLLFTGVICAQTVEDKPKFVNFPYTLNPKTKTIEKKEPEQKQSAPDQLAANIKKEDSRDVPIPGATVNASDSTENAVSPTDIYRVGVGDILLISLQNAPPNVSTYFTVLKNGAIDYPLAGGMIFVLGLTPAEIETVLRQKVKLYENPQLSVKVREYSSHSINVLGLVEKPGIKYLQREAVPLYIVRAEAIVQPRANQVSIRRAASDEIEQYSLIDPDTDEVLIYPGDIVEFSSIRETGRAVPTPMFYYIGGNIKAGGQKEFYPGITLTQAILAAGGLTRSKIKRVVIRRKDEQGLLVSKVYNLKSIKDGKIPDPILQAGDTIEVEN